MIIAALLLTVSWLVTGCGNENGLSGSSPAPGMATGSTTAPAGITDSPADRDGDGMTQETDDPAVRRILEIMDAMTLEEKVGQMLFLAYRRNADDEKVLQMDEALKNTLSRFNPGGFALFADNLESIDQTVSFINQLQAESKIPLFVSVDEEGGIVTRLNKAPQLHSTVMPDAFTIGLTGKPEYAYSAARAIASELLSLGFNMNFAPVADIFSNPENKVIGKRAYGTEPELVSSMIGEAVSGYVDGRIIPVLKHFPGHGDTFADTHTGAAAVEHDLDRLTSFEFLPFREGIAAGADAVMIAHILLPKLMGEPVPATLSKNVVTGLLRERLGFDGVVITDAMEMSAVSAFYEDDEAAVMAVLAGVDMILMPQSAEKAFNAILSAVEDGTIMEERIDESVFRILWLKEKYGILDNSINRPDPEQTLGNPEHQDLAREIREHAKQD